MTANVGINNKPEIRPIASIVNDSVASPVTKQSLSSNPLSFSLFSLKLNVGKFLFLPVIICCNSPVVISSGISPKSLKVKTASS